MGRGIHNRYAHSRQDRVLAELLKRYARGRVIDIGCGMKPYASLFPPAVEAHIGLDRPDGTHGVAGVDVLGTADQLPFASESFALALATNVLEHLRFPARAVAEAQRVLIPGGVLVTTTPFLWHIHEAPRDFFRFTRFGLEEMILSAGLEVVEIRPASGFWGTFGQLAAYNLDRHRHKSRLLGPLLVPFILAVQYLGAALDRVDRDTRWTFLYFAVARKPVSADQQADAE